MDEDWSALLSPGGAGDHELVIGLRLPSRLLRCCTIPFMLGGFRCLRLHCDRAFCMGYSVGSSIDELMIFPVSLAKLRMRSGSWAFTPWLHSRGLRVCSELELSLSRPSIIVYSMLYVVHELLLSGGGRPWHKMW